MKPSGVGGECSFGVRECKETTLFPGYEINRVEERVCEQMDRIVQPF